MIRLDAMRREWKHVRDQLVGKTITTDMGAAEHASWFQYAARTARNLKEANAFIRAPHLLCGGEAYQTKAPPVVRLAHIQPGRDIGHREAKDLVEAFKPDKAGACGNPCSGESRSAAQDARAGDGLPNGDADKCGRK